MANVNKLDFNAVDQKISLVLDAYENVDTRSKALSIVFVEAYLEVDVEDAIDAITDGGNDRGCDALFIDDSDSRNDIHIIQTKCVQNFENSKKNFPSNEIDKVVSFVSDLLSEDMDAFAGVNAQLRRKIHDALVTLERPNAKIYVHFVGNTAPIISSEISRARAVFSRYNSVNLEMHDLEDLSDFFITKQQPKFNKELKAVDTNHFARTDSNVRGMVCTVEATDLVEFIRSEENPEVVEHRVFDQNVRVFLKRTNAINRKIIESALSDDNHMFWYKNNGITITCDKFLPSPMKRNPTIGLENVQIVNGGQTSNCLFLAAKEDASKVEDVLLLVRIIETTSEDVKAAIAESTNSQTPIKVRDLRANDKQLRILEEHFSGWGLFFERKHNQFVDQPAAARVDALEASQAYLAYGVGLPEVAKKDRGRIFGDLYETVFSDDVSAEKLLFCFKLIKEINLLKKDVRRKIKDGVVLGSGEMALIDGSFHVMFAVKQVLIRDSSDEWDIEKAREAIPLATRVVRGLYANREMFDANFSSNRFFKEARTKEIIAQEVASAGPQ
ncbi:AIPR family protein [Ponticaulis sp.]|uniref:AIPR family protein n=1 Tax=Ponticaulis sp. TaxID=2020902 RepID=UPI00262E6996|nr:AIPR family protein [Ponticaulis sp.]MDF1680928.1 AIPR family protein [Ponticaulis sp.]